MRIVAIAGGKGGVGKSLLAANAGIYLAQIGRKVVLVDADPFGPTLHGLCGLETPPPPLGRVPVADALRAAAPAGLSLASAAGVREASRVLDALGGVDADYVVLDLPPSPGRRTQELWLGAHDKVLVTTPEPLALEGAFRFVRSAFSRRVASLAGGRAIVRRPPDHPFDVYERARASGGSLGEAVLAEMRATRLLLVVSQARSRSDLELGMLLRSTARRRTGLPVEALGVLEADEAVSLAVRKRRPLLLEYPDARMAKNIERAARRLLALDAEPERAPHVPRRPEQLNLYELLEVDPGSTDEEVRRAHRRVRELFGPDSLATCGLFTRGDIAAMTRQLQDAYDTLIDPERRRQYDLETFPDGRARVRDGRTPTPAATMAPLDVPSRKSGPEPPVTRDTVMTGELLRQIREARGIDLADISRRTKVGVGYLRAIEDERFDALPALVYVRGFLVELARCLHLPVEQVTRTYLARLRSSGHEEMT